MKTPAKILSALAATCLAFVSVSQAQLITYTTETLSYWGGNTVNLTTSAGFLGETFTGVSEINSLTYAFVSSATTPASGTLTYTFGEWNGSSFTSTLQTGTISVLGSNFSTSLSGSLVNTTDGDFDLSAYSLDSTKTYALLLSTTSNQNFGLGWMGGNTYSYGKAYDSAGNFGSNVDYAFAYISVEVPAVIPESSTVAAILGCVLVAGLVGFRLRQQRQLALAPVNQVAA